MGKMHKEKLINKETLFSLLAGLAVAVLALLFIGADTINYQTEQLPPYDTVPPLATGDSYTQEIHCTKDGLREINLFCATYARENTGTVTITLRDDADNQIQTWAVDASSIPDNDYIALPLDAYIGNSNGQTYFIDIHSDSSEDSAATFYTTTYKGASGLSSSGNDLNVSLCYTLVYGLPSTYLINPQFIITAVILLLIFPIIFRITVIFFPMRKTYLILLPMIAMIYGCHKLLRRSVLSYFSPALIAAFFVFFCALWIIGAVVLYRFIFVRRLTVQKLAVILLSVFAVITISFLPPGSGHDEQHHYAFSYQYSNWLTLHGLSPQVDADGDRILLMRDEDAELLKNMRTSIAEKEYNYVVSEFKIISSDNSLQEQKLSDLRVSVNFSNVNVPLGYVVPGLGIAVGRALHLGALPTFYLGRIFNSILFIVLVYWAIKIISVGKETLFVISMFPMVWQQIGSFSYDSLIIGLAFLFTAFIVNAFRSEDKISRKMWIALGILSVLLASCKLVYAPIILIILALPEDKLSFKDPHKVKKITIISLTVLGVIGFIILDRMISISQYFKPSCFIEGHSRFISLVNFLEIFMLTVVDRISYYLSSLVAFPGWYQFPIPEVLIVTYYLFFILTAVRKKDEKIYITRGIRVWGAVLVLTSSILIALAMATSFTEPNAGMIDGIQGRYFLPMMPLIGIGLRTNHITVNDSIYKKVLYGSGYMGFVFYAYCMLRVYGAV